MMILSALSHSAVGAARQVVWYSGRSMLSLITHVNLAVFILLVMLALQVLVNTAYASDKQQVQQQTELTLNECSRESNYSIYLSGIHTGSMHRVESWKGKHAVVISKSKASILGIGTQYQQRAELSWSNSTNEWITEKFHQKVTGFRARDMQVAFDKNGLESQVNIDGDIDSYSSEEIPLRDVDTLLIQMRQYLLQGRKQFALIRQASDDIEPYQMYVQDPVVTNVAPWGELSLLPVKQSGAEDVTYYFAPSLDYQLIKARYHGIILQGLIELDSYSSTCEAISQKP